MTSAGHDRAVGPDDGQPPCLVTGATRGIGRALALELARRGVRVVITGRDERHGETVRQQLSDESGGRLEFAQLDLSSMALVREGAARIAQRFPQLLALVNNAGVYSLVPRRTRDGLELTMAVNYVAPFLLTRLLLPVLRRTGGARILNVGSRMERWASNRLASGSGWRSNRSFGFFPYAASKRALVLFTRELARRLAGSGVTVNCVHPGFVATDLLRDLPRLARVLYEPMLLTPEESADMLADLVTEDSFAGVSGRFFFPGFRHGGSRGSRDERATRELWRVTSAITGLDQTIQEQDDASLPHT